MNGALSVAGTGAALISSPARTGARLIGFSPNRAGTLTFTFAAFLGTLSGVLIAPVALTMLWFVVFGETAIHIEMF